MFQHLIIVPERHNDGQYDTESDGGAGKVIIHDVEKAQDRIVDGIKDEREVGQGPVEFPAGLKGCEHGPGKDRNRQERAEQVVVFLDARTVAAIGHDEQPMGFWQHDQQRNQRHRSRQGGVARAARWLPF